MILSVHEFSLKSCALLLKDETFRCRFDVEASLHGSKMMLERVKTETKGDGVAVMFALEPTGHCSQSIVRIRPLRHQCPMPAEPA